MKFFNYFFYRISSAYKYVDSTGYYISGNVIVSACQAFNIIFLLKFLFTLLKSKSLKLSLFR